MDRLTIRLYEKGDEEGIVRLFNAVFPCPVDLGYWKWKYAQNPAHFPWIAVALRGSEIVGHCCYSPARVLLGERIVLAGQGVDAVLADASRRGLGGGRLIIRLERFVVSHIENSGVVEFRYGFPIPEFRVVHNRLLGARTAMKTPRLVKIMNIAYLARALLDRQPLLRERARQLGQRLRWHRTNESVDDGQNPPLTVLNSFDERFDRFWESMIPQLEIAVVRDRRYLSWRYSHSDYLTYAVAEPDCVHGFIVLRTRMEEGWRVGHIADFLAGDHHVARRLFHAAVNHFHHERVDLIHCWFLPQSPYYSILRKFGFFPRPSPHELILRTHSPSTSIAFLCEPAHWYLTLGDSDGI